MPGAEAFLNEEGRADKPISIDDESDDDQPRDATEVRFEASFLFLDQTRHRMLAQLAFRLSLQA